MFDFFGNSNAELVDDVETFVFVNHPLVAKGDRRAFVDGCFETVDQIKNVHGE